MTDLNVFADLVKAQDEGIAIDILHPRTGEELGIVVHVAGPDSARQQKAQAALLNEQLNSNPNKKPSAAEIKARALNLIIASIIEWDGVVEDGKTIEFSKENAVYLLKKYPFIAEQ